MTLSIRDVAFILAFGMAAAGAARADDLATYSLTLKNHRFTPTEIHVPSGKPFFIIVTNQDDTADEFEMSNPAIEKVIPPGDQGKVRMRPLGPGRFPFFGDFHRETAQGVIVSE
ncbi:cupredoxin domain-containing protein [Methylocapsa sp. S129]|uniref:cupredoxin domain-containing protein n=1 Tax=Methylocapsa sp. S129 TaxID=1641869 RepID=UPI00131BE009|nr:cupredoxin domain-containing protein [Methylocapsa sp. S129]